MWALTPLVEKQHDYVIYTDGSCLDNGGEDAVGGMGIYCETDNRRYKYRYPDGLYDGATNNRCELFAALIAMKLYPKGSVLIMTDSNYLVKGMDEWSWKWRVNDWMNSKGKPVENKELWESLLEYREDREITFKHVQAHVGIYGNELADALANEGALLSV